MRRYVLVNEDGTVNNILYLENEQAIADNEDWNTLTYFDYTDWAPEDHPRTHWVYDFNSETWGNKELPLPVSNLDATPLVPLEEPVADELAGGNE